ncbi:hypothetical protein HDV00_000288 [Rhizophlyctis rosea]|nr:hypothetical protein HDV00_000288 [Rhizophlyctis rosea]
MQPPPIITHNPPPATPPPPPTPPAPPTPKISITNTPTTHTEKNPAQAPQKNTNSSLLLSSSSTPGLPFSLSQTSQTSLPPAQPPSKSVAQLDAAKVLSSMGLPPMDVAGVGGGDTAWQGVCGRVVPLFSGGRVRGGIEEVNGCVRHWLHEREMAPHIAIEELYELFSAGMMTLCNRLSSAGDDSFASRAVELWSFFFGEVVPYLEGVFLPVRLFWGDMAGDLEQPDIRTMVLSQFRDLVILPLRNRLEESLPKLFADIETSRKSSDAATRLLQMLLIVDGVSFEEDASHVQVHHVLTVLKEHMWSLGKSKTPEPSLPPSRPISVFQT